MSTDSVVIIFGKNCIVEYTEGGGLRIQGLSFMQAVSAVQLLVVGAAPAAAALMASVAATTQAAPSVPAAPARAVTVVEKAEKEPKPEPKPTSEPKKEVPKLVPKPAASVPVKEEEDNASSPAPTRSMVSEKGPEEKSLVDLENIPNEIVDAKNMRAVVMYFVEKLLKRDVVLDDQNRVTAVKDYSGNEEAAQEDARAIYREFVRMGATGQLPYFTKITNPKQKIADILELLTP